MKVYICSRYRAPTNQKFQEQLAHTKEISREVALAGHEVITPHLYYTQFLDDNIKEERLAGTKSAIKLLDVCDAIFVSIKDKVSEGMEAEIQAAKQKNMKIRYFKNMNELKDILKDEK